MAEMAAIPTPVAPANTDVQPGQAGGPPPVPAGFSDAPPVPAGFSDTPPAAASTPAAEPSVLERMGSALKEDVQTNVDLAKGMGKGLGDTVSGIGSLIHKIPGVGEMLVPQSGLTAEKKEIGSPENAAQWIGYGGENLAEFLLGDEALKGLSLADKFKQISGVMTILEKSPRLMRAIQLGTDVGKAVTELGPEEQEAIKKSPMLARLVGAGMDAIRQGAVQGVQTTAKTGSPTEGAKAAATTTATSGVLGTAFGMLGRVAEKAGEAGSAVKEASALGQQAPSKVEMGEQVSNQVRQAEETMHGDFEKGIQDLKGKLGDAKTPYSGSPLQKAAANAMEGRADVPELNTTTLGKAFKGINGGSEATKNMLTELTNPSASGDLTIDELVQRRQQLGEKIGQLTKGATTSQDRADVAVYRSLRDGIDDTIDKLAKDAGSPEASQDYQALRGAYRDKVKLFQTPIIQALTKEGVDSGTALDNAGKYLLSGGKVLDKVNTLEQTIGPDATKQFGQHIVQNVLRDASSESGQINPAKFAKDWKKIDALPPEVKQKLFDMTGAASGLDQLSKDLKSAANYQKLVRVGVLGPGTGGLGLPLGILAAVTGGGPNAIELLDKVANSPKMWSAFQVAGSMAAKAATSPTARVARSAATYGTSSALRNVLQGASSPLSQDENGVYTNQ